MLIGGYLCGLFNHLCVEWLDGSILFEIFSGRGTLASKLKQAMTTFSAMRIIVSVGLYPLGYVFSYLTGVDHTLGIYNLADFINRSFRSGYLGKGAKTRLS